MLRSNLFDLEQQETLEKSLVGQGARETEILHVSGKWDWRTGYL